MPRYRVTVAFAPPAPAVDRTARSGGSSSPLQVSVTLDSPTVEGAVAEALARSRGEGVTDVLHLDVALEPEADADLGETAAPHLGVTTAAPDLVSVSEAAVLLHVSRQAVLRRIATGTLTARKVGATYAIERNRLG